MLSLSSLFPSLLFPSPPSPPAPLLTLSVSPDSKLAAATDASGSLHVYSLSPTPAYLTRISREELVANIQVIKSIVHDKITDTALPSPSTIPISPQEMRDRSKLCAAHFTASSSHLVLLTTYGYLFMWNCQV